jgi:hypothetical protein
VSAGALAIGDVIEQVVEFAQAYDANGTATGSKITDQASADRVPRGQSLGFYGPTTIRRATPAEASFVAAAEQAHHDRRQRTAAEPGPFDDDEF